MRKHLLKHVRHRFRTRTECERRKNRMKEEDESHATVNGEIPQADRPKILMDLKLQKRSDQKECKDWKN